jgi:phospholipid transport system substrate-binding protein
MTAMIRRDRLFRPWGTAFAAACGLVAVIALSAGPAAAGSTGAEAFVQKNIDRGIALLKNKSLTDAGRRNQVHDLLVGLLDTKTIGLFALGPARKKASQADLDAYVSAFNEFMIANYESRLSGYGGQSLKVTGDIERAPGDHVVTAVLVDPAAPNDPDPVHVNFRVLDEGGKFAVVDASIAGVWLGLAQRDDFVGFLGQHGDSVPALTAHLKEMTAKFEASSP